MKIIELTQNHIHQHNPIWVNSDAISYMEIIYYKDETYTRILMRNDISLGVMESPEEIIELIKKR